MSSYSLPRAFGWLEKCGIKAVADIGFPIDDC